jgi:nitroreductase
LALDRRSVHLLRYEPGEEPTVTIQIDAADELLSTTRAVRKRLDLARPVPREVILDCVRMSQQAPTGGNQQGWRWIVVTDPAKRAKLADIYRACVGSYFPTASEAAKASGQVQTSRVYDSAQYLADHLHEVPALVIPCVKGRPSDSLAMQAAMYGSIFPAVWSFNLALRARGLGTALTTMHLMKEGEAAALLGVPDDYTQVALLPVAYTLGEGFKPADRPAPETIVSWDAW